MQNIWTYKLSFDVDFLLGMFFGYFVQKCGHTAHAEVKFATEAKTKITAEYDQFWGWILKPA
jgi:hypothetical protein